MKAEFIRDFKHNYLAIQENNVLTQSYEIKMMSKNEIDGIITCQDRMINGEGFLYYDITSKQTFKNLHEDEVIGMDIIKNFFKRLIQVRDEMERFLLYDDGLILDPEYIFLNLDDDKFYFIYYKSEESNEGLKPLIGFLIERINSDDMDAVESIYQMADMVERSHYALDETLRWFKDEYLNDAKEGDAEDYDQIKETPEINYIEPMMYSAPEIKNDKKKGIFGRIKELFFKDSDTVEFFDDPVEEENDWSVNTGETENNGTVFIPWVENNEHKLYGIGKKNKTHIDLTRAPITIGKNSSMANLVIQDESISRMHAKITRQNAKYFITDLNSTNGSYKNGLRLNPNQSVVIEPGDEIGFGRLKFIYR